MAAAMTESTGLEDSSRTPGRPNARTFGSIVRERRRHLNFTQEEVARRVNVSNAYIGHLESNSRCPSPEVVTRLASALALDRTELFFLACPSAERLLKEKANTGTSVWEQFRSDTVLQEMHGIGPREMEMLSRVAMLGRVRSVSDFIYILNAVRQAIAR